MKKIHIWISLALLEILSSCALLSEHPGPGLTPYSKAKELLGKPAPSAEELRWCPNLNGKFENESSISGEPGLDNFFRSYGFQIEPQHVFGAEENGGPIPTSEYAIHLLGGVKNGVRQRYKKQPGERYTIEIRHTKPQWVWLVVRSNSGKTGEGEGVFFNQNEHSCRDNVQRSQSNDGEILKEWWIEPKTGDIVGTYPFLQGQEGKLFFRYKRLSN